MFELYNETARRSLFFSRYEASVLGSRSIETEHLLLGLLKDRATLIAHLLGTANVTVDALRQQIYTRIGPARPPLDTTLEIPFSKDGKLVLDYTAEEARRLLHDYIGCEHLLLGLLRLERGLAWEILRDHGLSLGSVREALVLHVSANSPLPREIAGMLDGMLSGASRARRSGLVYLMTARDGPSPGRRRAADDTGHVGFISMNTIGFGTRVDRPPDGRVHSIGPITMAGATLAQLALVLENFLGAPVIVEDDALHGTFEIELRGTYDNPTDLIAALRVQLGLELTKSLS
jgi:hypothetical protein